MFLRIKTTTRPSGKSFSAVLVKSERIDGKPRQRIVAHIGALSEKYLHSAGRRAGLWRKVAPALAGFTRAERERAVRALNEVIPLPTVKEMRDLKTLLGDYTPVVPSYRTLASLLQSLQQDNSSALKGELCAEFAGTTATGAA
jgi:hypothetical protein